eukprot:1139379-Pelagomonas_calceolata.AAC.6
MKDRPEERSKQTLRMQVSHRQCFPKAAWVEPCTCSGTLFKALFCGCQQVYRPNNYKLNTLVMLNTAAPLLHNKQLQ